jgi:penicillin-insensitive murein endopeptidase
MTVLLAAVPRLTPRRGVAAAAALAATLTFATGAFPGNRTPQSTAAVLHLEPAALRFGRSIGSPTEGHLLGGAHLDATAYVRVFPADAAGDVRWGLEPLVHMIDRAARTVRHEYPETVTWVGHLSREGGGEIDRHRSHESGRDADVGFFVRSANGKQLAASHFVPFRGDGAAVGWPGAYFDDAKNWSLVAAMVSDPDAHVTHVFVASPLRARLLAYAEHAGAPAALRIRAAELMQQPHGALPHDDHFHVRIACPPWMTGCIENPAPRGRPGSRANARPRRPAETKHLPVTSAPKRAASGRPPQAPPPPPPVPADSPETAPPPPSVVLPVDDVDG